MEKKKVDSISLSPLVSPKILTSSDKLVWLADTRPWALAREWVKPSPGSSETFQVGGSWGDPAFTFEAGLIKLLSLLGGEQGCRPSQPSGPQFPASTLRPPGPGMLGGDGAAGEAREQAGPSLPDCSAFLHAHRSDPL